jgi:hypothetical protein
MGYLCAFSINDFVFAHIFKAGIMVLLRRVWLGRTHKRTADSLIFFLFFENIEKFGLPLSELGPHIFLITVKSSQDLSSMWKCLNTGCGARKNRDSPFWNFCIENNHERCYHRSVGNEKPLEAWSIPRQFIGALKHVCDCKWHALEKVKQLNPTDLGRKK